MSYGLVGEFFHTSVCLFAYSSEALLPIVTKLGRHAEGVPERDHLGFVFGKVKVIGVKVKVKFPCNAVSQRLLGRYQSNLMDV